MELLKEEKDKKVYIEGNKIYTILNVGNYVGYKYREWYEQAKEVWRLIFLDEKQDDKIIHMEALIDDLGNYTRFLVDDKTSRRIVNISDSLVYSDIIYNKNNEYISLNEEIYSNKRVVIHEYFLNQHIFKNSNDEVFEGELSNNKIINEFLNQNDELVQDINREQHVKKSK